MADVNPPPNQQLPRQFFEDREVRKYMEQFQFTVFQLWKRTGGGTDIIQETIILEQNNTATNQGINSKLARLTQRVAQLENDDRSGEFRQGINRLNQRIDELVDAITKELQNFHRPNREFEQSSIELTLQLIKELRLLSARVEEGTESGITIDDIEEE